MLTSENMPRADYREVALGGILPWGIHWIFAGWIMTGKLRSIPTLLSLS